MSKKDCYRPVGERIKDFAEVEIPLGMEELEEQAKRCLNCGIPFCHGFGCPLGNMIPDQNSAFAGGGYREAYELLSQNNDFPEFTSRICPALCEGACVHQLDEDAVEVRHLEREISERAFREGWVEPVKPKAETGLKYAVIGAGPAGLAAAVALRRKGIGVVVYEKEKGIGGLLRYGIPAFKLDKAVIDRRRAVLENSGIRFVTGIEVGRDLSADYLSRAYDGVVVAIGTPEMRDLKIEGRGLKGIFQAKEYLGCQNKIILKEREPFAEGEELCAKGKDVLVIGGGDTGSDCVGTAIRQGAKSVAQIEIMPKPPAQRASYTPWPQWPVFLRTSSSHKEGCQRRWSLNSLRFEGDGHVDGVAVESVKWSFDESGRPKSFEAVKGSEEKIKADMVLLALGFTGVSPDESLVGQLGMAMGNRGVLLPDAKRKIFCVGDCATGASLVVKAMASGKSVPV